MSPDIELLSPAGSMDALRAALANGADAVYLGASLFGARSSVGFDEDTLRQAIALAHLHKRRIHVTVNTLVKDDELPAVRRTLETLARLNADAVLVQDMGIMRLCLSEFPSLAVHASTQMTIHNAYGASLLREMGVRRVVLARECDLNAIRRVAQTGIETEVFAHGALCVSVSGQCLFSSMIGGRSGNRGRCAQPCRLPYAFDGKSGAWLSPRDLCVRDRLPELISAGVASLKIEGRLKRPEYVAVVTRAYRGALDAAREGRFTPADAEEKRALTQIFARGGFTLGRAFGREDAAIIEPSRVKPMGVEIGVVTRVREHQDVFLCDAQLTRALHNGDGLEIDDCDMIYSGQTVESGGIATLRLRVRPRVGATVRRTDDECLLETARQTYEGGALDAALPIPLSARLTALAGQPLSLTLSDGQIEVTVTGEACQTAMGRPLDIGAARRSLGKTGGTPYILAELSFDTLNAYVPAAALNALRRDALEKMTVARITAAPLPSPARSFVFDVPVDFAKLLYVMTSEAGEAQALRDAGADKLIYAPRDVRPSALDDIKSALKGFDFLSLPPFCDDDTSAALVRLAKEQGIDVFAQNVGHLVAARGIPCVSGADIPVMNAEAARMLRFLGARAATLSLEMSADEAETIPKDVLPLLLPVYGRTRLMLLKHCPYRAAKGLSDRHADCVRCFSGAETTPMTLTDRYGCVMPVIPQKHMSGCVNALYAHRITDLRGEVLPEGVSYLVSLTDESPEDRLSAVAAFRARMDGAQPIRGEKRFVGRFRDGVQ